MINPFNHKERIDKTNRTICLWWGGNAVNIGNSCHYLLTFSDILKSHKNHIGWNIKLRRKWISVNWSSHFYFHMTFSSKRYKAWSQVKPAGVVCLTALAVRSPGNSVTFPATGSASCQHVLYVWGKIYCHGSKTSPNMSVFEPTTVTKASSCQWKRLRNPEAEWWGKNVLIL